MIISTARGKPFSLIFMLYNFAIFQLLNIMLLDKIVIYKNVALIFISIIVLAVFTALVYILMNIWFRHYIEKDIVRISSYIEQYDCFLYDDYDIKCIVKLNNKTCKLYYNELNLFLTKVHGSRAEYILSLKSSFINLNKTDILFIYLYKYISVVVVSVIYFFMWFACISVSLAYSSIYTEILAILPIVFLIILLYFILDFVFSIYLIVILKKRNLEFFATNL